ncbi:MAG: peptide deformylase [Clostridia bacterium]|nr:peptide deformylase [Clostridia bacterium]
MALRDIVKDGDSTLRRTCREVTTFDEKLGRILDDMLETMVAADGVGLAAPQVGIARRYAVCLMSSKEVVELINPTILEASGEEIMKEGCLSCPNKYLPVKRAAKVLIRYQNRQGEWIERRFEGFDARVCQHEMDHLDGILFYDKAVKDE